jgi:hypothetical protein
MSFQFCLSQVMAEIVLRRQMAIMAALAHLGEVEGVAVLR